MAAGDTLATSGLTSTSKENILFGAGVIYKDLEWDTENTCWDTESATILGATQGGTKLTIKPEFYEIEVDGTTVKTKDFNVKTKETAEMEINALELTSELLQLATVGTTAAATGMTGYNVTTSKELESSDYIENLAFVGYKTNGDEVICIFPNAICTSGLEIDSQSQKEGVYKITFECVGTAGTDTTTLPWKIYTKTATQEQSGQEQSGQEQQ